MRLSSKYMIIALHDLVKETQRTLSAAPRDAQEIDQIQQTVINLDVIDRLVNVFADNEEIYYECEPAQHGGILNEINK